MSATQNPYKVEFQASQHQEAAPRKAGSANFFYKAMGMAAGEETPAWTWAQMVKQIGAPQVIERLNSQMTNLGIVSALCLTMTMAALQEPPSDEEDEYKTALQVYGSLFAVSTFCLAGATLLSVTILIQLNTIRWDDANLIEALECKNSQNVISVWSFQFFNIGILCAMGGFNATIWILYDRVVFWVAIGSTVLITGFGSLYFAYIVAAAMMSTWKKDQKGEFGVPKGIEDRL